MERGDGGGELGFSRRLSSPSSGGIAPDWGMVKGGERRGGGGGRKSVLDIYVQIQREINEHHRLEKCCKVFGSQQEEGEKKLDQQQQQHRKLRGKNEAAAASIIILRDICGKYCVMVNIMQVGARRLTSSKMIRLLMRKHTHRLYFYVVLLSVYRFKQIIYFTIYRRTDCKIKTPFVF